MHRCRSALIALLCSFTLTAAQAAPKLLLVVRSEGRDAGKTQPGFELDEFAKAWLTLRANGLMKKKPPSANVGQQSFRSRWKPGCASWALTGKRRR